MIRQNNILRVFLSTLLCLVFPINHLSAETKADSLKHYLTAAAQANPQLLASFSLYKAALERVPQAGAIPDPELEVGLFVKPMEIVGGKQVADFTLMQMFPWFGTRKAARNEATERARIAYEQFRDNRDNLFLQVKSQWFQLLDLREQSRVTEENLRLLEGIERLAVNRFSASAAKTANASSVVRIQLERTALENSLADLQTRRRTAETSFNALLDRPANHPICLPDSLVQSPLTWDTTRSADSLVQDNPALAMLQAEADAYRAKAETDRRMSYPMLGIGLQYSLIGKKPEERAMPDMNGEDMFMPMLKISLPLARRKYNAQQRESHHSRQASELKREGEANRLRAEYIRLYGLLEDASRKIALYERQAELANVAYQLVLREFSAGQSTLADVIQVERQLLDYRLKRSQATANYNTQVAGIERLVSTYINE